MILMGPCYDGIVIPHLGCILLCAKVDALITFNLRLVSKSEPDHADLPFTQCYSMERDARKFLDSKYVGLFGGNDLPEADTWRGVHAYLCTLGVWEIVGFGEAMLL